MHPEQLFYTRYEHLDERRGLWARALQNAKLINRQEQAYRKYTQLNNQILQLIDDYHEKRKS